MSTSERKRKWDQDDEGRPSKVQSVDAAEQAAAVAAQLSVKYQNPSEKSDDAEFVKDIEINDLRNRYLLTKTQTQSQIAQDTGASITTKGQWYPDKTLAQDKVPPLYLHITATTASALDAAVSKVNELIDSDLGPLTDRSTFRERPERKKWPDVKVYVGLESLRNFNIRARVVGPQGMFVKYIQSETGTKCQIKGVGSGFYEADTGSESNEPMHINIAGPDAAQVERAKELAEDLVIVVKEKWEEAKKAQDEYTASLNQPQYSAQQAYYNQYYAAYQQQYMQQYQQQQQDPSSTTAAGVSPAIATSEGAVAGTDTTSTATATAAATADPSAGAGAAPAAPAGAEAAQSTMSPEDYKKWMEYYQYYQYYNQQYAAASQGQAASAVSADSAAAAPTTATDATAAYTAPPPPPPGQ